MAQSDRSTGDVIVRFNGRARACWSLLILSALLSTHVACHRSRYRIQADKQAYELVAEKADNPHWKMPGYTIDVDPRSRMYSPFAPDSPPMPPDDPTAHKFMKRVDGKKGYPYWYANGKTPFVENPEWLAYLPLDEDGVLQLNSDDSVRVARVHSRGFQSQLEELYLSALDVSFERFVFDSQFFAGYSTFFRADGRTRAGAGGESRSALDTGFFSLGNRPFSFEKAGVTGSTLVVGLANRLMWQFSGPDTHTATTLLDFSIVQPLLRGAGRDRVMERLTLSERTLLANVRQMERFRRGFYLEVVTGVDAGDGPRRRGGVFGGSGLGGFTGVGGGGFGQLAGGGNAGGGRTGAGQVGGFIGLLQLQKSVRNQEINVAQLRSSLVQFQEFARANRIDYLQVQQSEQALYNAQSALINTKVQYQDQLDQFKVSLGLPPQIDVDVDDDMLDRFNLLDPEIQVPQNQLSEIQQELGQTIIQILNRFRLTDEGVETLEWSNELAKSLGEAQTKLAEADRIRQQILDQNVRRAEADLRKLQKTVDQRTSDLERLQTRVNEAAKKDNKPPDVSSLVLDKDQLLLRVVNVETLLEGARKTLVHFEEDFQRLDTKFDSLVQTGDRLTPEQLGQAVRRWLLQRDSDEKRSNEDDKVVTRPPFETEADSTLEPLSKQLSDLAIGILELSLVQARARADAVTLVPIDLDSSTAFEIAKDYRRDWMNRRAALVDSWRLIEFNADNLESTMDVVFEGDISNAGDNPLDLRDSTGRLRAGIQFDAPITRLDERNTYRQSLIEYQQARRAYYAFRDEVSRGLRGTLRSVVLNQLNFELRRSAILVAIEQVELARLRLQEPPKPEEAAGQRLGATTARDLVSALSDLLNAQNDFISVWATYEVLRRTLDFDLGTMQLDENGIWIDPGTISPEQGYPAPGEFKSFAPDVLVLPHLDREQDRVEAPEELPTPLPAT